MDIVARVVVLFRPVFQPLLDLFLHLLLRPKQGQCLVFISHWHFHKKQIASKSDFQVDRFLCLSHSQGVVCQDMFLYMFAYVTCMFLEQLTGARCPHMSTLRGSILT